MPTNDRWASEGWRSTQSKQTHAHLISIRFITVSHPKQSRSFLKQEQRSNSFVLLRDTNKRGTPFPIKPAIRFSGWSPVSTSRECTWRWRSNFTFVALSSNLTDKMMSDPVSPAELITIFARLWYMNGYHKDRESMWRHGTSMIAIATSRACIWRTFLVAVPKYSSEGACKNSVGLWKVKSGGGLVTDS